MKNTYGDITSLNEKFDEIIAHMNAVQKEVSKMLKHSETIIESMKQALPAKPAEQNGHVYMPRSEAQ